MKSAHIFLIGSVFCGVATAQPERQDESFASRLTGSKCEPGDTVKVLWRGGISGYVPDKVVQFVNETDITVDRFDSDLGCQAYSDEYVEGGDCDTVVPLYLVVNADDVNCNEILHPNPDDDEKTKEWGAKRTSAKQCSDEHKEAGLSDKSCFEEATPPFTPTNDQLSVAAQLWCQNKVRAEWQHGNIAYWKMDKITTMQNLFSVSHGCTPFNEAGLTNWNVSQVTDFSQMFYGLPHFDVNVSSWDVSNGVNFYGMFAETEVFNQDLSKWDFSSAENIGFMFTYNNKFQTDASKWVTLNVVDMTSTFYSCAAFSSDLTKWDVRKVQSFGNLMKSTRKRYRSPFIGANVDADWGNWIFENVPSDALTMERFSRDMHIFLEELDAIEGTNIHSSRCTIEEPGIYGGRVVTSYRFVCNKGLLRGGIVCEADNNCDSGVCRGHCCTRRPNMKVLDPRILCGNDGVTWSPLRTRSTWLPDAFLNATSGWNPTLVARQYTQVSGIPGSVHGALSLDATRAEAFAFEYLAIDGKSTINQIGLGKGIIFALKWALTTPPQSTVSTTTYSTTTRTQTTTTADSGPCSCVDNEEFLDNRGESCEDWSGYACLEYMSENPSRYDQADKDLIVENCPITCGICDPEKECSNTCVDSATFRDFFGEKCGDWAGYQCEQFIGFTQKQVAAAKKNCPKACGVCDERQPMLTDPKYNLLNACSDVGRFGNCEEGNNPVGVHWSESKAPGSVGIDGERGLIYSAPEQVGPYTAWLLAVDTKGTATARGLPSGLDQVLLKRWDFIVEPPTIFDIKAFENNMNESGTYDYELSVDNATKIYAIGALYSFPPITITEAEHPGVGGLAGISFTFDDHAEQEYPVPPGFLLSPITGFFQGTPTKIGRYLIKLYGVRGDDNAKSRSPLRTIYFDVREGPNGAACENGGKLVPSTADLTFTCNCAHTAPPYEGDNCEIDSVAKARLDDAQRSESVARRVAEDAKMIGGGVSGGIVLLTGLIILIIRYRQQEIAMRPVDFDAQFKYLQEQGIIEKKPEQKPREIKRKDLTLLKVIGGGQFGDVWQAELDEPSRDTLEYTVAAKTIKDSSASVEATNDLLAEAGVMAAVGAHPNLVSLIGIVTRGDPMIVVISFCAQGSILDLLKKGAAEGNPIEQGDKMKMAHEVARGMEHLTNKKFIHRDLAARNILYAEGMCKVADFGLSRSGGAIESTDGGESYYKSASGIFPVRWTAPEAMETLRFTPASDMWSYGIVIVEMIQDGETPYRGTSNPGVMKFTMSGGRHPKPRACSDKIYAFLLSCWDTDVDKRPFFHDAAAFFKAMRRVTSAGNGYSAFGFGVEEGAPAALERFSSAGNGYSEFGFGVEEGAPAALAGGGDDAGYLFPDNHSTTTGSELL